MLTNRRRNATAELMLTDIACNHPLYYQQLTFTATSHQGIRSDDLPSDWSHPARGWNASYPNQWLNTAYWGECNPVKHGISSRAYIPLNWMITLHTAEKMHNPSSPCCQPSIAIYAFHLPRQSFKPMELLRHRWGLNAMRGHLRSSEGRNEG